MRLVVHQSRDPARIDEARRRVNVALDRAAARLSDREHLDVLEGLAVDLKVRTAEAKAQLDERG